jgi:hypothetical protein
MWDSHLAVVELLSTWAPDEILDFHETLIEHIATGRWTNTGTDDTITLGFSGQIDAASIAQHIQMNEMFLEMPHLSDSDKARISADLEVLRTWTPAEHRDVPVPAGHIGIPLHAWASLYGFPVGDGDPLKKRKKLAAIINDESAGAAHENRLLLRAAPWAYHRVTGQRLSGVLACPLEEFHATGTMEWFTTVVRLSRGSDLVEYLAATPSPSADAAAVDRSGYFAKFARSIGARIDDIHARPIDAIAKDSDSWFVSDGQVISDQLATPDTAAENALSMSLHSALFEPSKKAPARMEAATFWKLIALLDAELSDGSVDTLVRTLCKKPLRSITGFHETLTDQLYALDRPELTKPPGSAEPSMMSDDVFLHFRCAVVARGTEAVASVLAAGGIVEGDWRGDVGEILLSVAARAWELKTGEPFEYETELSYESASNAEAWGRDPVPSVIPIGAHAIRSVTVVDGVSRERVRFWKRPDLTEALAAHRQAERELWGDASARILDSCAIPEYEPLSTTVALGRVSYFRPISVDH